ncbi:MAG TPA: hypothetical protein DCX52_01380 [Massilia sp.]|nr:hypothetical protein [Massilia sp.]
MAISPNATGNKRLTVLEFATLIVLAALSFWAVRPLLEEWGLFNVIKTQGIGYILAYAESTPMRPLHLLAIALNWELGQGHLIGIAAGNAVMMVLRYGVARWAVSPVLAGNDRWVIATLAAVLPAWSGIWFGRFGAAQLSLIFFFAVIGFSLRLARKWSWSTALACVASVWLLLSVYQALALCLVAMPLFALLWQDGTRRADQATAPHWQFIRLAVTIGTGFVCYALYAIIASRLLGGGSYEATLAQGSSKLLTVAGIAQHVMRGYATAFARDLTLPLMLLLGYFVIGPALLQQRGERTFVSAQALFLLLVASLPLFSLIYMNELHIGDPDRVMLPVATAFVVALLSLMVRYRPSAGNLLASRQAAAIVLVLLVVGTLGAASAKKYADLQETVLAQTLNAVETQQPRSLLLHDATGRLGDVYTFLNPLFSEALAVHGHNVTALICTPRDIDRIHPDAQRYPIPTTQRCDEVAPMPAPVLVLTVRDENGTITVRP